MGVRIRSVVGPRSREVYTAECRAMLGYVDEAEREVERCHGRLVELHGAEADVTQSAERALARVRALRASAEGSPGRDG